MIRETFFHEHLLVLEHINKFSHYEDKWDVPNEISHQGIYEYLKCGREKGGKICKWLVDEGWMKPKLKHIVGRKQRVTTYYPTQKAKDELATSPTEPVVEPEGRTYPSKWIWNNRVRKWIWS